MKLLFTSDWHLDHITASKPRLSEIRDAADQTVESAIKEGISHWFFLGDLMDPDCGSVSYRALEYAASVAIRLGKAGIYSHWLAGNHDVIEDGTGSTTLTPLKPLQDSGRIFVYERAFTGYAGTESIEDPPFEGAEVDGWVPQAAPLLHVVALPFAATSHAYEPEKIIESTMPSKVPMIIIGHLNVAGVIPGEETNEMPRGREVMFPREAIRKHLPNAILFNGHYHRRQVHDGVHIPGSLARLTFGEEQHHPGYLIVEV